MTDINLDNMIKLCKFIEIVLKGDMYDLFINYLFNLFISSVFLWSKRVK